MIAQYYKLDKLVRVFSGNEKVMEFSSGELRLYGFPPFHKWERTDWGYQLEFRFEVTQAPAARAHEGGE
jgi:hypothetical protein